MTLRHTLLLQLLVLSLILAGCGGDDDDAGEASGDDATSADTDVDQSDDGDDGGSSDDGAAPVNRGGVAAASIDLTGTVEQTYDTDTDSLAFIAAGGCQGGEFGLQLQANDLEISQTLVQIFVEIEADLDGGATGTFDIEDLEVGVFEPGDITEVQRFDGPGTLEITEHDTDAETPRLVMTISGTGLEAEDADGITIDGETVDLTADLEWAFSC